MKTSTSLFAALAAMCLVGINPAARAQDYPDLKGTWTGTSETVLLGNYAHGSGDPSDPKTLEVDFTLTLDNQEGRRVWGTISSPNASEPWLGVIALDGTTILGADTDGHAVGTLLDPDTLDLCYTHT